MLLLVAALVGAARTASAREPTRAELEERIRRLEEIIRAHGLDRLPPAPPSAGPAAAPPPAAPAVAPPAATARPLDQPAVEAIVDDKLAKQKPLAGWSDGFYLQSPNGDFRMKLRGYMQTQARNFVLENGDTGTDSVFMRRVRPVIEGTVYRWFDFKLMPSFDSGDPSLQDAYFEITYLKPWVSLRGGKDKVPMSLERLQSGADLLFPDRSIANNLSPNRDVGFRLAGDVGDGIFVWQAGVYDGVPDGLSTNGNSTSDNEGVFRALVAPFRGSGVTPLEGAMAGFAATYGSQKEGDDLSAVRYRTPGRSTFFRYAASSDTSFAANGVNYRLDPQGYWYWGQFGLMGEYIYSRQAVRKTTTGDAGTTIEDGSFANQGWFAQASWVLTGEAASYKGVVPKSPFDPLNGAWGAFELAGRGSIVDVDPGLFRRGFAKRSQSTTRATELGLGANWYFNKNFKLQADWEHTTFANAIDFGGDLRDHEDVLLFQFQIQY
ncbi:MAG: hypothetical protein KIT14_20885 [bacterium]|nr:hypothetical protein [bacterium]